jgi:hypothetical protein
MTLNNDLINRIKLTLSAIKTCHALELKASPIATL